MVREYGSQPIKPYDSYLMCWILGAAVPVLISLLIVLIVYLSNL